MANKQALIIGTEVANNGFESGASLRLNGIRNLLEESHLEVTVVSRSQADNYLRKDWDLVVLVSFATAKFLRKARKSSKLIWFDPTDSWQLTRFSLIRSGELRQITILIRDLLWLWSAPKIDMLTFISRRDAEAESAWWSKRMTPVIYPVHDLDRTISPSTESRLVFVGDGKYGPNKRSIDFLTKVLDLLPVNQGIHVYGRGFENLNERFVLYGYSSDEEMYFSNDIHLAPIESGAGLKLKVAVPLANGIRVISTPEGANGFKLNPNLIIAADEKSFAIQVLRVVSAPKANAGQMRGDIYEKDETSKIRNWINQSIFG
jgi:hypothetical protein